MSEEFEGSPKDRMATGYRLATARNPNDSRMNELIRLHDRLEQQGTAKKWTIISQVLLNLDEALSY